jgi:hypothetical protein
MDRFQAMLDSIGLRLDAKYTSALAQQLEFVRAQTYDIKYPEYKARQFIPVDNSVDPGAETISYYQWDMFGMADICANYADDPPMVSALAEKFFNKVEGLHDAYDFTIQDMRRSAMSGMPLEDKKATAARRAMEARIDDIAATGYTKAKLKGLLNNPNVTVATAASDGTSTKWLKADRGTSADKAPADILSDMYTANNTVWTTTKEIFQPDTVLLPTAQMGHIMQTQVNSYQEITLLRSFLANNPFISLVDSWHKLATADAAGTGPRMVTYKRSSEVLELVIPQEFEQFPEQVRNLSFVIPCHARVGGVVIRYPLAVLYTDGL